MALMERYRHELAPLKAYLKPKQWLKSRDIDAVVKADLLKMEPFFRSRAIPDGGKTILFAGFVNLPYVLKFEGLFSRLLGMRGWKSLCLQEVFGGNFARRYHHDLFGHPVLHIPDFVRWGDGSKILSRVDAVMAEGPDAVMHFEYNGSLVGPGALSSASTGDSTGSSDLRDGAYRKKVRTMMVRSCLYSDACARILARYRPDLVLSVEKGGVGASEIFFQSLKHGVDFVQWSGCHQPESIMLKRYNKGNVRSHPFSVSKASWSATISDPWDEAYRQEVMGEFEAGYGGNKWFKYKKLTDHTRMAGKADIIERFKLDPDKKIAVIFAHILNDANLFYGKDLFEGGFREWLVETVRVAAANPRVNWLLKLHPANTYRRANIGYSGEFGEILAIKQALGEIPANLNIILPDDAANPLSWFRSLDYAITVRGTIGAEIPCFGKQVLTAGTGRYSGLGFTEDSASREEYLEKIRTIDSIPPLDEQRVRLAIRHAYLFFKSRPASYSSFAEDTFPFPQGHPFNRDLAFKGNHYSDLASLPAVSGLMDWLSTSKDEDFLGDRPGPRS